MKISACTVLLAYCFLSLPAREQPGAKADIEVYLKRLAKDQPKAVRLEAIKALRKWDKKESLKALPALERCLKHEEVDVRSEAIHAVAEIAHDHLQPCPLGLVEAYLDANREVRELAVTYAGTFRKHPRAALAILFRALESEDAAVRADAAYVLASVERDPKIMAALRQAAADKSFGVRNNAHVALWKVTGDLSAIVPFWLEVLGTESDKLGRDDRERTTAQLVKIAAAKQFHDLGAERPQEVGRVLIETLASKQPVIRAMAARSLGAIGMSNWKSREALLTLKVEEELGRLLKDTDPMVQTEAKSALQRLKVGDPKGAIRHVLDDQVIAWNKGDLNGFMEGYWQSPELSFFAGGNKTRGWQATLDRYRKKYQGEGKEMGKLAFKEIEIKLLGTDTALVTGRWHLELRKETVGGLFTLLFEKKDTGWRIVHDHTSS